MQLKKKKVAIVHRSFPDMSHIRPSLDECLINKKYAGMYVLYVYMYTTFSKNLQNTIYNSSICFIKASKENSAVLPASMVQLQ
jgi:hypothetical protein